MMAILIACSLFSGAMASLNDGLVAYWSLNGNTNDSLGNSNLTNTSSVTFTAGKASEGATITSSTQKLSCADNTSLSITGALTLSVWFKLRATTVTPTFLTLINKYIDYNTSFFFYLTNPGTGKYYFSVYVSADGSNQVGVDALNDGQYFTLGTTWHHAVFVFVPSTSMTIYLDGVSVGSKTTSVPASIHDGNQNVYIGSTCDANDWFAGNYFDGMLDEVRIYNRVLTAAEVSQLYDPTAVVIPTVNTYLRIASLPDMNSNGYAEIASLGMEANTGKPLVKIYDSNTNDSLKRIYFFDSLWTLKSFTVCYLINDSIPEIGVLAAKGDSAKVECRRISDGVLVKTIIPR